MTADQPDGSARGERGGWLSSPLARWLLGVAGSYSEVLAAFAIVGGKLPALFKIPRALRPLDAGARIVAAACLVLLALLVGATCLRPELAHRLTALTWADGDQNFTLPRVALYLSLIGWAISAAMILAGASRWNLAALVLAGIVQLFAIVFIGLAGGKAYWLAAPSWLLPLLAATSPAVARWPTGRVAGTVSLCALATWHTYLFTRSPRMVDRPGGAGCSRCSQSACPCFFGCPVARACGARSCWPGRERQRPPSVAAGGRGR